MQSGAAHTARSLPCSAGGPPCLAFIVQQRLVSRLQCQRRLATCRAGGDKDLLSKLDDEVKADKKQTSSSGKGFGAPPPAPKSKAKAKDDRERPFKIELPSAETQTPADKFEEAIVRVLALLFLVFLAEGLSLAVAGFLSEEADAFITTYIYPAFSPTLGVFLAISTVYGLFKARQGSST